MFPSKTLSDRVKHVGEAEHKGWYAVAQNTTFVDSDTSTSRGRCVLGRSGDKVHAVKPSPTSLRLFFGVWSTEEAMQYCHAQRP